MTVERRSIGLPCSANVTFNGYSYFHAEYNKREVVYGATACLLVWGNWGLFIQSLLMTRCRSCAFSVSTGADLQRLGQENSPTF